MGRALCLVVGYAPGYVIINDPYTLPCSLGVGEHLVLTESLFYNVVVPASTSKAVIPIKRS
jgi:hypothetical protein